MGYVIADMGTGAVEEGSKEQSEINIKKFISDCFSHNPQLRFKYEFIEIEKNGRHTYELTNEDYRTYIVQMPAVSLEKVRFMGEEGQTVIGVPRLYVDGSSWLWKYAIDIIGFDYEETED